MLILRTAKRTTLSIVLAPGKVLIWMLAHVFLKSVQIALYLAVVLFGLYFSAWIYIVFNLNI